MSAMDLDEEEDLSPGLDVLHAAAAAAAVTVATAAASHSGAAAAAAPSAGLAESSRVFVHHASFPVPSVSLSGPASASSSSSSSSARVPPAVRVLVRGHGGGCDHFDREFQLPLHTHFFNVLQAARNELQAPAELPLFAARSPRYTGIDFARQPQHWQTQWAHCAETGQVLAIFLYFSADALAAHSVIGPYAPLCLLDVHAKEIGPQAAPSLAPYQYNVHNGAFQANTQGALGPQGASNGQQRTHYNDRHAHARRAMPAQAECFPRVIVLCLGCVVHVSIVSPRSDLDLRGMFQMCGAIRGLSDVALSPSGGRTLQVEMESPQRAQEAVHKLHNKTEKEIYENAADDDETRRDDKSVLLHVRLLSPPVAALSSLPCKLLWPKFMLCSKGRSLLNPENPPKPLNPLAAVDVTVIGELTLTPQFPKQLSGVVEHLGSLRLDAEPVYAPATRQLYANLCRASGLHLQSVHGICLPPPPHLRFIAQSTDPVMHETQRLSMQGKRSVIFDACITTAGNEQLRVVRNFVCDSEGKMWYLLLRPVDGFTAEAFVVRDRVFHGCCQSDFDSWLNLVHAKCLGMDQVPLDATLLHPLSLHNLTPNLYRMSIPLFLVLDLDKTVILNQHNHDDQVKGTTAAHAPFASDFTAGNHRIQLRGNVGDFISKLSHKFSISVLCAGSAQYAAEVVQEGNRIEWRPKAYAPTQLQPRSNAMTGPQPVRLSTSRVWSSLLSNAHTLLPCRWTKHLSLVYACSPSRIQSAVLIVDDDVKVWDHHVRPCVYPMKQATVASNMAALAGHRDDDSPRARHIGGAGAGAAAEVASSSTFMSDAGVPMPKITAPTSLDICAGKLLMEYEQWQGRLRQALWGRLVLPVVKRVWAHLLHVAPVPAHHLSAALQSHLMQLRDRCMTFHMWSVDRPGLVQSLIDSVHGGRYDLAADPESAPPTPIALPGAPLHLDQIEPQALWSLAAVGAPTLAAGDRRDFEALVQACGRKLSQPVLVQQLIQR